MIVKLAGKYLIWSKIVDAPLTFGMTLEELIEHVRDESGRRGLDDLPARLARVEARGTSSLRHSSAVDTIWFNRAGAGETCMTIEQLVEHYVTNPTQTPPRGENESGGGNPEEEGGGPAYPKHWEGRTP